MGDPGPGEAQASAEYEACFAYVLAECERRSECGFLADCTLESVGADCPDRFFAQGSQLTPDGLLACAAELPTYPCRELSERVPPACLAPGTRKVGESCVWGNQCESATCGATLYGAEHPECQTCRQTLALDQDCVDAVFRCPPGTSCDDASHRCQEVLPESNPPPGPSQPCSGSLPRCAPGLLCNSSGTCMTLPGAGEPCYADDQFQRHCAKGTLCFSGGLCEVPPGPGERCATLLDGYDAGCQPGSYCKGPLAEAICTVLPVAGEACVQLLDFDGSLAEWPADAIAPSCAPGFSCNGGTCGPTRVAGQRCEDPSVACATGTTCIDGTCQQTWTFVSTCGG